MTQYGSSKFSYPRLKPWAAYMVKSFRLYDKVLFKDQEGFIFGRRTSGSFKNSGENSRLLVSEMKACLFANVIMELQVKPQ